MEVNNLVPLHESSSNSKPEDLLEECWFFGKTKKAILRCYSDPCPSSSSSSYTQEMLARTSSGGNNNSVSAKKFSRDSGGFDPPPPLPPPYTVVAREDQGKEEIAMSKSIVPESSRHNLVRTPSLPPCVGREEDVEGDFALSKLIRQASLSPSDVLPPRRNSKVMKQSSSTPRRRPRKNPDPETEACNEMRGLCLDQPNIIRKSLSDLQFKFEKKYANPSEDQSSEPPVPIWVDKNSSSAEDMKAQIKFWARAVAANVR